MTGPQAAQLAIALIQLILRFVPDPDEREAARQKIVRRFVGSKLDELDDYARKP